MKRFWLVAASLIGPILWSGCQGSEVKPPTPVTERRSPSKAQPKLRTVKLWLGSEELIVEQAISPKEIETGMMYRESMQENEGMIFVFAEPHRASFWMRNTILPLSCAYIDGAGVIRELHDMTPLDESPIGASISDVQYVLEVNQGWFKRHNVAPGVVVQSEVGTLRKTFFGVD